MLVVAGWRLFHPPLQPKEDDTISAGIKNLELGRYNIAYEHFRRTLALNPKNEIAIKMKKVIAVKGFHGMPVSIEKATQNFEKLIEIYPNSNSLKMIGAESYFAANQLELALQIHSEVAINDPEIPQNWFGLGVVQRTLLDNEGALNSFMKAASLSSSGQYLNALGDQHFFVRNWPKALEAYQKAIEKDWWRLSSKFGYLRALIIERRLEEAQSFGQEIINLLETKPAVVEKFQQRPDLIIGVTKLQFVSDVSREELITYCKVILGIVDTLRTETNLSETVRENLEKLLNHPLDSVLQYDLVQLK